MSTPARIEVPHDFQPRPYQEPFMRYFDQGGKRAVWVMHRRGGKDLTALHQTHKMMWQRVGAYWHVFPTLEQARKAIWEGFRSDGKRIMENVFPSELRKSPRAFLPNAEMVVELKNGSIWRLMGSDKMEVVGAGPVGVVFSEFALSKPRTWDLTRPMLRENDGWAAFITTPRGNNHAKKLFDMAQKSPGWFCQLQTLRDTRAYDPEKTLAEERAEGMPEALIRQEYLCDWTAANLGAVWGDLLEELEKRGGVGVFDVKLSDERWVEDVFTTWDLGLTDATAIWFFVINAEGGIDVIDYYEAHGKPLSHYYDVLEQRATERRYRYRKHWLPHDANHHTLAAGTSILNQMQAHLGNSAVAIGPQLSLLDGIQAGRWLLQRAVRIHAERCADGLEALRAYRYEFDDDRKDFGKKPVHDWSSHGADSFRYLAVVVRVTEMLGKRDAEAKSKPRSGDTLDELWEAQSAAGNTWRRIG